MCGVTGYWAYSSHELRSRGLPRSPTALLIVGRTVLASNIFPRRGFGSAIIGSPSSTSPNGPGSRCPMPRGATG